MWGRRVIPPVRLVVLVLDVEGGRVCLDLDLDLRLIWGSSLDLGSKVLFDVVLRF